LPSFERQALARITAGEFQQRQLKAIREELGTVLSETNVTLLTAGQQRCGMMLLSGPVRGLGYKPQSILR
jgi:hypothetical protein